MSNVDLLTQETIETVHRRAPKIRKRAAHRFGDFAVHRGEEADLLKGDWTITHLPTGRALASEFRTFERAVDAMVEVARLRNDWAVISDEDIDDDLKIKCRDIISKFGGYIGQRKDDMPREPAFNGYAALSSRDQP
jgi:hypothetical protein